jgi:hypothetical protein
MLICSLEIQNTTLAFREKNDFYRDSLQVEIKLFKESRVIKYIFLTNSQEIIMSMENPKNIRAFYNECAENMDSATKDMMDKLLDDFNNSPNKDQKDLILLLRDIFTD